MTYVLDNLTVKQGGEVHLDGLSLTLPSSGVVTVIGRTQAGKTTLLKVLAGLIAPSSGSLTSGEKICSRFRRGAGGSAWSISNSSTTLI